MPEPTGDGAPIRSDESQANDWRSLAPPAEFAERRVGTIEETPVPDCPVCGAADFAPYAVGFDYEILTCANPWRFVSCRACGHVWLNPRPAVTELSTIYPETYYAYDQAKRINPIALRSKALLDAGKLRGIFRALGRPLTSYLDIGCGSGQYLRVAERRGVSRDRIYGLELDADVVASLRSEGYQAFNQRVETCDQIPDEAIDLATMFHVVEHVDDPLTVVERVFRWLKPGGIFALETPNLDSLDARRFKETYWGGYHIPRHWNLFRPSTLHRLLERAGYEIVSTKFQTGHSFWMYSLHHALRYGRFEARRVARWFNPFTGLPFLVMFTGFDKVRATLGFRTSAMLVIARRPQ